MTILLSFKALLGCNGELKFGLGQEAWGKERIIRATTCNERMKELVSQAVDQMVPLWETHSAVKIGAPDWTVSS